MKYSPINKLKEHERLEFWIVTALIITSFILGVVDSMEVESFPGRAHSTPSFGSRILAVLFPHTIAYSGYLFLLFFVSPQFKAAKKMVATVLIVFGGIAACIIFRIIPVYLAALLAIKIFLIYFSRNRANKENALYAESALLLACWMIVVAFLGSTLSNIYVILYLFYVLPIALVMYLFNVYRFLPTITVRAYPRLRFVGKSLLLGFLSGFSTLLLLISIYRDNSAFIPANSGFSNQVFITGLMGPVIFGLDSDTKSAMFVCTLLNHLLIVAPLSWNIFKRRHDSRADEINTLKTELGKSDANLSFLKSQINPHFLFNALNTLYGTALQENAERTGEGIQKLGDMMRFMLHENMQDKIPLSRDIEYMRNYILLQKLRTSVSEKVSIQDQITVPPNDLQITPMLLIPFIENAFKHGISLINPSHIRISLEVKDNTLYLDVSNSVHLRTVDDTKTETGGVGLQNVKQRLELLYRGRHELVVRENASDFFIHLTMELEES